MPPPPPRRFLIVGSGIAGSLLAWELLQLGAEITLCSDSSHPGSSRVAAGLITPITGRRFVKSWNLDRVFPQARLTYEELRRLTGKQVFQPLPILRLFKNPDELERWHRKSGLPEMREFIVQEWSQPPSVEGLLHEGGGIEIRGGGWVDMAALIESLKFLMQSRVRFISGALNYDEIELDDSQARWRQQKFDHVIFCQGYRPENPWFDWLDWKPAQGEILTLRIPGFANDRIINRGLFLLPLGGELFRCGSTYSWDYLKSEPSEEGRAHLEAELRRLLRLPFEIIDHRAAVRPILKDTLPVIGLHPRHPALGIFNGLGSKGALTAPFYARHFARHLIHREALDPEIQVIRNR